MAYPDDLEGYQKGYEDAMRAAGSASASVSATTSSSATPSTTAKSGTKSRDLGGKFARGTGTVIGYLVGFPFLVFLITGTFALLFTQSFDAFVTVGLFFGGLAFLFALFVGVVKVGFRVFIEAWPIILVVVIAAVIVTKAMG
jgi:hypothetical protein